ncbi:MAG: DUF3306 domain-containing protein [Marinobacter sp.]|uniref:DUF3306 domain-containing protein n=1 Tax=unclassified Marinobacter TaxID=83889 RepID=UPI00273A9AAA|nr:MULTISPECIES: DUF3306 domain-containing protein [unclassified Marinobacter]MDP4548139.1 DUF3306 domain-containing protein [Marinobacter sp. MDS2]
MAESRLQRWSRLKTQTDRDSGLPTAQVPSPAAEIAPEEQELARNEALSEQEILEKYGLPDPDNIELGTDVTGFMRKEIPDLLRRKALRSLWRSNPVLAVLDGLNDYDEDFTAAGPTVKGAQTLYKVGQGLIDRSKKLNEQAETPAPTPDVVQPETKTEPSELRAETEAVPAPDKPSAEPEAARPEPDVVQQYRPRMRFE